MNVQNHATSCEPNDCVGVGGGTVEELGAGVGSGGGKGSVGTLRTGAGSEVEVLFGWCVMDCLVHFLSREVEGWKVTFLAGGSFGGCMAGGGVSELTLDLLWRISTAVWRAVVSLSVRGSRGEFLLGFFKAFKMSLVAVAMMSTLEAVGIVTSCGNHSRVSVILSALVDQMWVV